MQHLFRLVCVSRRGRKHATKIVQQQQLILGDASVQYIAFENPAIGHNVYVIKNEAIIADNRIHSQYKRGSVKLES